MKIKSPSKNDRLFLYTSDDKNYYEKHFVGSFVNEIVKAKNKKEAETLLNKPYKYRSVDELNEKELIQLQLSMGGFIPNIQNEKINIQKSDIWGSLIWRGSI